MFRGVGLKGRVFSHLPPQQSMKMRPLARPAPRGLYLITPDVDDTGELLARCAVALAGGPTWLQYRNKSADAALRRGQASALLALCREHRVPLIVNDDWRLAAELGAEGAHLGEDDGEIAAAREALGPDALLGASCYNRLDLAESAARAGASYVAFGAFFPSSTKPLARRATPDLLEAAGQFGLPRVAIGGIRPDNAGRLVASGADLVAVIEGVFGAPDPAQAVREYRAAFGDSP